MVLIWIKRGKFGHYCGSNCRLDSWYIITLAISKCYEKVRVLFFRATTRSSPQLLQFRRSRSIGKTVAFQLREFVFEPVRIRFFSSILKQFVSTFFGTMRLFPLSALWDFFENFSMFPKGPPFSFFAAERMLKNPKGSLLSNFSALSNCSKVIFQNFWDFQSE